MIKKKMQEGHRDKERERCHCSARVLWGALSDDAHWMRRHCLIRGHIPPLRGVHNLFLESSACTASIYMIRPLGIHNCNFCWCSRGFTSSRRTLLPGPDTPKYLQIIFPEDTFVNLPPLVFTAALGLNVGFDNHSQRSFRA